MKKPPKVTEGMRVMAKSLLRLPAFAELDGPVVLCGHEAQIGAVTYVCILATHDDQTRHLLRLKKTK